MTNDNYHVKTIEKPIHWEIEVPGSKSITNRALLMAALTKESVVLTGVLFSHDSRYFLKALQDLGFQVEIWEDQKKVRITGHGGRIPAEKGEIYVGSAGTAARFLTAMLGLSAGRYCIQASEQMKKRPMKELFTLLEQLGAGIVYLEEPGFLPIEITGRNYFEKNADSDGMLSGTQNPIQLSLDIHKSTQFLSAMLLTSPMISEGLNIHITSEKTDGSYIRITRQMMKDFGAEVFFDGNNYTVPSDTRYQREQYEIEPDVSAACYFYGAAAITGGSTLVKGIHPGNSQGDMKFLQVLKEMGCRVKDQTEGICVTGPECGKLHGITVDMNDFSDQTMTLAAMAPFAAEPVHIKNVGHIRLQESDRLHGIATELKRVQVPCEEARDEITIYPGCPKPAVIETYEDHRMAMAFSLLGLRAPGIEISNPGCCKKTFEDYFSLLDKLTG